MKVDRKKLYSGLSYRGHHAEYLLLFLFLCSLFLINPWVRGDGVGYYAFARAPLIQHNFDFKKDYQYANASFREYRLDENGQPRPAYRTVTGHLQNHFTVGPAMLWSPFLLVMHGAILLARALGSSVAPDGFSAPYRVAMAFATALYSFIGLLLAFRIARHYVEERWAFLATLGIWTCSSLPVYMYFNPSWSHAHSAFAVSLFLWYWHRTADSRTLKQWALLGACGGLMLNIYYPNAMVLAVIALESGRQYFAAFRGNPADSKRVIALLSGNIIFGVVMLGCMLPTFITRYIIYGGALESGYIPLNEWLWRSPVFFAVLFSSNHGLLIWTPLLIFSIAGLILLWRYEPRVGAPFLAAFLAFYFFIACYPDWAGISSYGNRFFVSLTPVFVLGLAFFLQRVSVFFSSRAVAVATLSSSLAVLALWNAGLIFQWGTHLIPARGPISISKMAHNQFFAVPQQFSSHIKAYFFRREALMQQIENSDRPDSPSGDSDSADPGSSGDTVSP